MVIDELIVTLGLDPKQFNQAQKDALAGFKRTRDEAHKTAVDMEAEGRRAGQFYGNIKKEAVGAIAVIVGANSLKQWTATTVNSLAAVGRAAKSMGLNVSELAAFRNMIERSGGDADEATASFRNLTQEMERFRVTGQSAMLPALSKIGARREDSALTVYEKFAGWAQGKDAKLVTYQGQQLGLDEASILKAMQGRGAVRAGIAESYRLGVPNEEDIKKISALQMEFRKLKQAVQGSAQELLYGASVALRGFLWLANKGIERFPVLTKVILGLGAAFTTLKTIGLASSLLGGGSKVAQVASKGSLLAGATRFGLPVAAFALGIGAFGSAGAGSDNPEGVRRQMAGRRKIPARIAAGGSKRERAIAYFMSQGWTHAQAVGLAANIEMESAWNESNVGDGGNAYGLGQWHADRQADFAKWAGRDIRGSSFEQQLAFMQYELTQGKEQAAGRALRATSGYGAAGSTVSRRYERPRAADWDASRRAALAETIGRQSAGRSETNVGTVTINTQATDANGIARDFSQRMSYWNQMQAQAGKGVQ